MCFTTDVCKSTAILLKIGCCYTLFHGAPNTMLKLLRDCKFNIVSGVGMVLEEDIVKIKCLVHL